MKNFSRFSILAVALVTLVGSASAVDFNAQAQVEIVEGIDITETAQLNFGILANRDGSVVVDTDGAYTDANSMMYDNSSVTPANFSVQSSEGANITASASDPGGGPTGLTISAWTFQWDNTTAGAGHNIAVGATTAILEVGATMAFDSAAAGANVVGGGVQNVPWDLSVVFQ